MTWIEPLNLRTILVTMFAGTIEIFMFVFMIFIAGMAAYFRMLPATLLIMYVLFGVLMAQYFTGIYFLAILIGGLVVAYLLSKLPK